MGGNINRNVQCALCYLIVMVYCCRDPPNPMYIDIVKA